MPAASRSAERFAAALEHGEPADAETRRLTALAHRLEAVPGTAAGPRPAARAAALAAFSAGALEVARHGAPHVAVHGVATTAKATTIAHSVLLPVATGLTAVAVAASGVAVAAHRSLPGDPFYSVKRATEDVQQHLAGGGVSGARERLAIARTRLAEIRREAAGSPSATRTARIAGLVSSMDHDVALASQPLLAAGGSALTELQSTVAGLDAGLLALPADAIGPAVSQSETLLAELTTATAKVPAGGLPGVTLSPGTGASTHPTAGPTAAPSAAPTTAPSTAPSAQPTADPTHAPVTSTGPTSLPTGLPSGLPTSLPTSGLPKISISVPISVPSLPVAISSVLGGLLGQ